jgi:predicted RNA binding protein YcfA (HicA-like mRNA interferase family)
LSDKLPAVRPKQLIRVLEKKGWEQRRVRGSHHYMVHPDIQDAIPVPVHNRDIKRGLLTAILKTAGISREEFRRLL